ncbi:helix-turn-helix domain-containing protein [Metapseudomonas lalkuanensis]|uniref:Helix-turn-helix domain-containing protein n=1 Tax=Metapseudomonas lalkuanensis TaxID=2604832 RepID=A0A5J6QG05_9GAMM|nr:RodZ family helix-turn-helix domain-containing protein [Pseudomonas lalkuanensis]QEY61504.1 helix-turn-helix domain-containing protein [Pseudomonas lalkuanensis]UCO99266.1 helix-turn-helix domain-containing protein [Pseudomonas lalkuanensis]
MKASHPEAVAATRANPGETLRQARESKDWSLGEVARHLNLTEQALRQLEAGDFEQLPGHTFARGYVRAYAKLLGMDQAVLVAEFDHYTGTDAKGSNVHSLGRIEEPVRLSQSVLRIVSFIILVALGAVGFFWWQEHSSRNNEESASVNMEHVEVESADGTTQIHPLDEPEDQAVAEAQESEVPSPAEVSPETAAQPEQQAAASDTPVAPAGETAPAAAAPAAPNPAPAIAAPTAPAAQPAAPIAPVATAPAAPATAQPVAPIAPAAPAAAPAPATEAPAPVVAQQGHGVVRIQFTANCWTQVTDADGKVLVSALKRTGDSVELAGKAPLEVRLGFARGAQVSYNGQSVDVSPFVRGETARLKLGQ